MLDRPRIKEVVYELEFVETAFVARSGPGLKGVPDGAKAMDVVGHSRGRVLERHGETPLDMGADLGPQPQQQPALADLLKIPGGHRHRKRAAGKSDCDVGAQGHVLGAERRLKQGKEGIIFCLEGP